MVRKQVQDLLALQEIDLHIRDLNMRLKTIEQERRKVVASFEVAKRRLSEAKHEM